MVVGLLLMTSIKLYGGTPPVDTVPHFPGRYADFYQADEIEIEARYQYVLTQLEEVHIYRRFFPETRTLTLYEEYTDKLLSTLHGVYKVYWDSGKPKMLGWYRNGERTGQWEMYRFDGSLQEEGEYIDGRKAGEWLAYHPNRELKSVYNYLNGDLARHCYRVRFYCPDGEPYGI